MNGSKKILKKDYLSVECPTCEAPKGKPCVKFPTKERRPEDAPYPVEYSTRLDYDAGRTVPMAGVHKARRIKVLYWKE